MHAEAWDGCTSPSNRVPGQRYGCTMVAGGSVSTVPADGTASAQDAAHVASSEMAWAARVKSSSMGTRKVCRSGCTHFAAADASASGSAG